MKVLFIFVVMWCLTSCAGNTYKPLVDTSNIQPAEVIADQNTWKGSNIQWGGQVLSVFNEANKSKITILSYPLDSSGRPDLSLPAGRRIWGMYDGYVESHSFPVGKLVTINGKIEGIEQGMIGDKQYQFAVVDIIDMKTWSASNFSPPTVNFGIGIGIGL